MSDDKREERLGRAVFGVAWVTFAIVFIAIASAVALALLWLFGGPLWLAPVQAVYSVGPQRRGRTGILQDGEHVLQVLLFRLNTGSLRGVVGGVLFRLRRFRGGVRTFFFQRLFGVGAFLRELVDLLLRNLLGTGQVERDQEKDDQKYDGNQVEHKMFHVQMPFMVAGKEGTGRSRPGGPRP